MLVCLTFLFFCFPFSHSLTLTLLLSHSFPVTPFHHFSLPILPIFHISIFHPRFNSKNIIVGFGINSTIISIRICILDQLPKSNNYNSLPATHIVERYCTCTEQTGSSPEDIFSHHIFPRHLHIYCRKCNTLDSESKSFGSRSRI